MFSKDTYDLIEREESPQALRLARWVMRQLQPRSVVDLGCATGFYLCPFTSYLGLESLLGVELDKNAAKIGGDRKIGVKILNRDLSRPIRCGRRFDLGLCIEVAEHMRETEEDALCENIKAMCRTIIFSAACEGQGGDGHINCRSKEYWKKKLWSKGLFYDAFETESFISYMHSGYHLGWIRNAFVATGVY